VLALLPFDHRLLDEKGTRYNFPSQLPKEALGAHPPVILVPSCYCDLLGKAATCARNAPVGQDPIVSMSSAAVVVVVPAEADKALQSGTLPMRRVHRAVRQFASAATRLLHASGNIAGVTRVAQGGMDSELSIVACDEFLGPLAPEDFDRVSSISEERRSMVAALRKFDAESRATEAAALIELKASLSAVLGDPDASAPVKAAKVAEAARCRRELAVKRAQRQADIEAQQQSLRQAFFAWLPSLSLEFGDEGLETDPAAALQTSSSGSGRPALRSYGGQSAVENDGHNATRNDCADPAADEIIERSVHGILAKTLAIVIAALNGPSARAAATSGGGVGRDLAALVGRRIAMEVAGPLSDGFPPPGMYEEGVDTGPMLDKWKAADLLLWPRAGRGASPAPPDSAAEIAARLTRDIATLTAAATEAQKKYASAPRATPGATHSTASEGAGSSASVTPTSNSPPPQQTALVPSLLPVASAIRSIHGAEANSAAKIATGQKSAQGIRAPDPFFVTGSAATDFDRDAHTVEEDESEDEHDTLAPAHDDPGTSIPVPVAAAQPAPRFPMVFSAGVEYVSHKSRRTSEQSVASSQGISTSNAPPPCTDDAPDATMGVSDLHTATRSLPEAPKQAKADVGPAASKPTAPGGPTSEPEPSLARTSTAAPLKTRLPSRPYYADDDDAIAEEQSVDEDAMSSSGRSPEQQPPLQPQAGVDGGTRLGRDATDDPDIESSSAPSAPLHPSRGDKVSSGPRVDGTSPPPPRTVVFGLGAVATMRGELHLVEQSHAAERAMQLLMQRAPGAAAKEAAAQNRQQQQQQQTGGPTTRATTAPLAGGGGGFRLSDDAATPSWATTLTVLQPRAVVAGDVARVTTPSLPGLKAKADPRRRVDRDKRMMDARRARAIAIELESEELGAWASAPADTSPMKAPLSPERAPSSSSVAPMSTALSVVEHGGRHTPVYGEDTAAAYARIATSGGAVDEAGTVFGYFPVPKVRWRSSQTTATGPCAAAATPSTNASGAPSAPVGGPGRGWEQPVPSVSSRVPLPSLHLNAVASTRGSSAIKKPAT
jgi:hypothetical protein